MKVMLPIVLFAVGAAGVVAQDPRPIPNRPSTESKAQRHQPRRFAAMVKALGLSKAQAAAVRGDLRGFVQQRREVMRELRAGKLDARQARAQMITARRNLRSSLRQTLTPDQMSKLRQMLQHRARAGTGKPGR